MKEVKLYNVIFPIWLLIFFPPVIFLSLAGNFVIDSLVVLACFYLFKLAVDNKNLKMFYKNSIIKVALTIAIVTMPWTFLLPTKWFYY